jgi:hypothetical protein
MPTLLSLTPPPIKQQVLDRGNTGLADRIWIQFFLSLYKTLVNLPAGILAITQATLPTGLGINETGLLVDVTDYGHILKWTGTNWTWGAGDPGSGTVQAFLAAPTGPGWHICNGATVSRLNADGTISNVTLPNYTTAAYLKLGIAAGVGPNPGSTETTSPNSAGTPSGTNSAPAFTGDLGSTSLPSDTGNALPGPGVAVALADHQHTFTPTGTVSAPAFIGDPMAPHTHTVPVVDDLRNTRLLAYYRQ